MIWIIIAIIVVIVVFGTTANDEQPMTENDWAELRLWDSHFWGDFD